MSKGRKKFWLISVCSIVVFITAGLMVSCSRNGVWHDGRANSSTSSWKCEFNSQFNNAGCTAVNALSYLKCDDLVVVELSNQPLMKLVAKQVGDELVNSGAFKNVRYISASQVGVERVVPAPDYVLTIGLVNLEQFEVANGKELKGLVGLEFGRGPLRSTVTIHTRTSHINVSYSMSGSLNFTAKCEGYGPEGSENDLVSRNISSELAKKINGSLDELREKYPTMPQLPATFLGTGKDVSDPAVMEKIDAKCILKTGGGFLRHSESYWLIDSKVDTAAFLGKVYDALIEAGYKTRVRRPEKKDLLKDRSWFFAKDGQVVELFEIPDIISRVPVMISGQKGKTVKRYGIRFTHSFSENEMKVAIASMLKAEPDTSISKLLPFMQILTDEQKQKLLDKMVADKQLPGDQLVKAARLAYMLKKTDLARQLLRKANCFSDMYEIKTVRSFAKECKDEKVLEKPITAEELAGYGFHDLSDCKMKKKSKFTASKMFCFFMKDKDGVLRTTTIRLEDEGKDYISVCENIAVMSEDGKITASSKTAQTPIVRGRQNSNFLMNFFSNKCLYEVKIKPADKPETFVCEVSRRK